MKTLIVFSEILKKKSQNIVSFSKILKILVLRYGCQINANFTYILETFIVFLYVLKNFTKYCIFFENTQNLSFAIWVSNERKFHIHFRNMYCVFRKYSKNLQNTVSFSKILKIWVLQYGCQINANFTYILETFIVFFENTHQLHKILYLWVHLTPILQNTKFWVFSEKIQYFVKF